MCDIISYLGAVIGNGGNNEHSNSHLSSCRRAFHSLQGAGLCKQGLNVETAVHVFKATCNSILALDVNLYIYLIEINMNWINYRESQSNALLG